MTDIILVHPIVSHLGSQMWPLPLNLLSISSLLNEEGYKIKIIDQRVNSNWKKELIKELKKNPVCVGVTSMIGFQVLGGLAASELVKKNSDVPVVWGGPTPTILPKITLENEFVDIICEGEGEVTFYELVKTLEKNKSLSGIKGIWYKENGRIKINEKRVFVDLNDLPDFPYNLLNLKDYKITSWQMSELAINVETSRGCPHHCAYCYNPKVNQRRWRALKPERVVELLKKLVDKYNVKNFRFHDDNFFVNQKRTNEIMEGILREGLDIVLAFQGMRVDTLCRMKKNELNLLYDAGCRYINFGLETGSPRILKLLKKDTTIEQAYATNKRLSQYSEIKPYYNFMAGFPTETMNDLSMTVKMMTKLYRENPNINIPILFLFIPWPGAELYDLALKHGFIPPKSLKEWGYIDWTDCKGVNLETRPWLSNEFKKMFIKVSTLRFLIDLANKEYHPTIKKLANPYLSIAKFRFTHNFYSFMLDGKFWGLILRFFERKGDTLIRK
jgi:anaerobic magnesium-protoporphyrin IX monomethyl ester cyclase